jgi:hypothetical protein
MEVNDIGSNHLLAAKLKTTKPSISKKIAHQFFSVCLIFSRAASKLCMKITLTLALSLSGRGEMLLPLPRRGCVMGRVYAV